MTGYKMSNLLDKNTLNTLEETLMTETTNPQPIFKQEFEIRHHQIEIEHAAELQVTDLLKEDDNNVAISKADLILIFALYRGGIIEFFELYKSYVVECQRKRWRACDKPHWYLKRLCD